MVIWTESINRLKFMKYSLKKRPVWPNNRVINVYTDN